MLKEIKYHFNRLNIAEKIIILNFAIFIVVPLITFLFKLPSDFIVNWFQLPSNFDRFIFQPWSLISYSFFHAGFMHIFWNMILLYVAGRLFLNLFDENRFKVIYFLGAIAGGFLFFLSYNLFPVFGDTNAVLVGASASVMAVLIFVCAYIPNQEIRLFVVNVKLKWIGIFFVVKDLIMLTKENSGGHLAHLGGAILGFVFARQLFKGTDLTEVFTKTPTWFSNSAKSKKKPLRTVHRRSSTSPSDKAKKRTDLKDQQKRIDYILDKISKSGYDSLSKEEKDFLFKVGKE